MNGVNLNGHGIVCAWKSLVRWTAVLALSISITACTTGTNDLVPDQSKVAMSIAGVGHYGRKIGIPEFFVDGAWGGNASGWGGGGGGYCCVLLSRKIDKPVMVTVQWQSCDIGHIKFINDRVVDPDARCKLEEHKARVPIHFDVEPGKSSGLKVHFLPGHRVEVWVTRQGPAATNYPGPKYPDGPAPDYAPLPDEKPALAGEAAQ